VPYPVMHRPSVDGRLLPAVMDPIFVENRNHTPPAFATAVNFNSFE